MNKDFAVPEFLGRTCNLMFQTAAAIGYAKKYGTDWFIPPHYHHRQIYKYWKLPVYKGNIRKLKVYDVATDEGWGYSPIPKFEGGVKLRGFFQSERHFDRPVDMNYIHQAVDVFRQYNKMKFLVFSDDIAWCKANLSVIKDAEFHYSEGQSEFGDLSRMASCSDHIIANSSFSWWGAYLGSNENKLVVSPDHTAPNWFAHNKMDTTHLIPSSWTEIKFR
jgi:hypothetical protein